jgi:virulence-associated protein VapD
VVIVSIYTHHIDIPQLYRFNDRVKKTLRLPPAYRQLVRQLTALGFVSQGSVFERAPGQQGSRYVWTRKVKARTVTVALSEAQYHWLKQAVANQRELERIVEQMQKMSHQTLFENVPGVARRKQLSKKVLGLN